MKKNIFKLLSILSIGGLLFTSCQDDDALVADVGVTVSNTDMVIGTASTVTITFAIDGTSDNKATHIRIEDASASSNVYADVDLDKSIEDQTYPLAIENSITDIEPIKIKVIVTTTGKSSALTKDFVINFKSSKGSSKILYNQSALNSSDTRFYSIKDDAVYTLAELKTGGTLAAKQEVVDFGYVTRGDANGGNKIVSPNSVDAIEIYATQWTTDAEDITNWTKRRNTKFKTTTIANTSIASVNDGNYDALIQQARTGGEPSDESIAISATPTNAILFKNEDGHYGLLVVTSATGEYTTSTQAGNVAFTAYYQSY